ncbi:MAG: hypothetical protein SLAVMIC_00166 [uncultured marine phage]|uniref:Uncharacterized protein n=1 Tax=uncultured marine phage TaxID=707152 RepID=A0A8D9CBM1_9VIRU|nr:MAG: hypothetical protein SLAVMIC_00166 [uncultured marine phage]
MSKLKFKHPSKEEPIEVLMQLYSIGVYVKEISERLKKVVDIFGKGDLDVFEIKTGHNGYLTNFKLNCDKDLIYTVMWMIKEEEISDKLAEKLAFIVNGDESIDHFPTPGGFRTFINMNNQRQGIVIYDKIPGHESMFGLMTTVDIEQHPLMTQLYREKRLGDILD